MEEEEIYPETLREISARFCFAGSREIWTQDRGEMLPPLGWPDRANCAKRRIPPFVNAG